VGVDDAHAHHRSRGQAELGGAFCAQGAGQAAKGMGRGRHPAVAEQVGKADGPEELQVPGALRPLVAEVGPFADRGAQAAPVLPRGPVDQEVGQIEEAPGFCPGPGQVLLQPEELGRLHFRGDAPAHVVEHPVAAPVDSLGLVHGPVVHPDDDVPARVAITGHGQRPVGGVQADEGAGGVEAQSGDRLRSHA